MLDDMYYNPLRSLDGAIRALAGTLIEDQDFTTAVTRSRAPMTTGHGPDVDFIATRAGMYAAHLVRLRAPHDPEQPPWAHLLHKHAATLSRRNPADRLNLASLLRRVTTQSTPHDPAAEGALLTAGWLTEHEGHQVAVRAAHLARHVIQAKPTPEQALATWCSVHGLEALRRASTLDPDQGAPGRPAASRDDARVLLYTLTLGMWSTGMIGKADLARCAGISRPTLDTWLRGAASS